MYGVQGQKIPDLNLLSQSHQGRSNHLMPSASGGNDDVPRMNPFVDVTLETQMRAHQVTPKDGGLVPFDSRVIHEEEFSRFQRKRKVCASQNPNMLYHYRVVVHAWLIFRMKRLECNENSKCKRKELEKSL